MCVGGVRTCACAHRAINSYYETNRVLYSYIRIQVEPKGILPLFIVQN